MKRFLLAAIFIVVASSAYAQSAVGGQSTGAVTPCLSTGTNVAVNTQLTLTVPPPPRQDLYVYICGWDWQVVEDGTGTSQTNVLWTTTNLGGVGAEYSINTAPFAIVSGNFTYPTPIRAAVSNQAVIFTSPAAAAHAAYNLNVYYRYGPLIGF